jgi:hypothetical protein
VAKKSDSLAGISKTLHRKAFEIAVHFFSLRFSSIIQDPVGPDDKVRRRKGTVTWTGPDDKVRRRKGTVTWTSKNEKIAFPSSLTEPMAKLKMMEDLR